MKTETDSCAPLRPLAALLIGALTLALTLPTSLSAQIPDTFENLQLLPKDIDKRALIDTMRGFSIALGVRCSHCHVGPENGGLAEMEFAADDKPTKNTARLMMGMVRAINEQHLAKLKGGDKRLQVSCQTCHRGIEKPRSLIDLLSATATDDGIEAAIAKYGELRDKHYGSDAYNFGEFVLLQVAEKLFRGGQAAAARQMLDLNAEHFKKSSVTEFSYGRLDAETGHPEAAKKHLRRALEYDPKNRAASRLLKRLEKPAETGATDG